MHGIQRPRETGRVSREDKAVLALCGALIAFILWKVMTA